MRGKMLSNRVSETFESYGLERGLKTNLRLAK
jgi:hypothetical protein